MGLRRNAPVAAPVVAQRLRGGALGARPLSVAGSSLSCAGLPRNAPSAAPVVAPRLRGGGLGARP
eukprot:7174741-Alexandrium_andersonii.AAC.1